MPKLDLNRLTVKPIKELELMKVLRYYTFTQLFWLTKFVVSFIKKVILEIQYIFSRFKYLVPYSFYVPCLGRIRKRTIISQSKVSCYI